MKNILMMICWMLLMSTITVAQSVDSISNRNGNKNIDGNRVQEPTLNNSNNNSTDPFDGAPRQQEQIQSDSHLHSQPELQPQPIQRQPQVPMQPQSQPVNPNVPAQQNNLNQNQLNQQPSQPMQPTQPVNPSAQPVNPTTAPTTPTGVSPLGTPPPK